MATTIAIVVLKIFDIIYVMTGGRYGTDVIANRMFVEFYEFFNDGRAAALATVLFLAVVPIMYLNVRNLTARGSARDRPGSQRRAFEDRFCVATSHAS